MHFGEIEVRYLDGGGLRLDGGRPSKLRASKKLAFVADLLPTRHHIPLPWVMAYDLYPLQTLETKRKWVPRLAGEGWIIVFGHDPDFAAATLPNRTAKSSRWT